MKLLHIDSSISGEQSVSRQLTAGIVARLKQAIPDLEIVYRDVVAEPVPIHSEALQNLKVKTLSEGGSGDARPAQLSTDAPDSRAVEGRLPNDFATINAVLDEFVAADIVVVGAPMYNFGIPSQLKAWIDCLAAPGKTFRYSESGVEGLCGDKRVIVASSRGGVYSAPSPMAVLDHQESHLTGFFGFIGVSDLEFVRAEGLALGVEQRQRSIDSALAEVAMLKAA